MRLSRPGHTDTQSPQPVTLHSSAYGSSQADTDNHNCARSSLGALYPQTLHPITRATARTARPRRQRADGVHNECSVVCKPSTVRNTQMNHSAGGTALWNRLETHGEMHTSFRGLLAVHLSHTTARSKRSEPSASPCPVSCPVSCPIPTARAPERSPSSPLRGPLHPFRSSSLLPRLRLQHQSSPHPSQWG